MLNAWFIPSSTGDFRLENREGGSLLTVENPTASELERCEAFLKRCRQWKWLEDMSAAIAPEGRTEISIKVPVSKCGKHLAKNAMPTRGTLTVIRSANGEITCTADYSESDSKLDAAAKDPKADKATTVKRPTACCPDPIEGPLKRASRVLREFCTPNQWADWVKYGVLHCFGGTTGCQYRLVHRHHPLADRQGKICWSIDDNSVLHFWDWSIPPAEEVLAAKLILEHREAWLRNSATLLTDAGGDFVRSGRLQNPMGNTMDGTWDAAFFNKVGDSDWLLPHYGSDGSIDPIMTMAGMLALASV